MTQPAWHRRARELLPECLPAGRAAGSLFDFLLDRVSDLEHGAGDEDFSNRVWQFVEYCLGSNRARTVQVDACRGFVAPCLGSPALRDQVDARLASYALLLEEVLDDQVPPEVLVAIRDRGRAAREREKLLVELLLDQSADLAARDDAAIDLGDAIEHSSVLAMLRLASETNTPELLQASAGESLGQIWVRRRWPVSDPRLASLTTLARKELEGTVAALLGPATNPIEQLVRGAVGGALSDEQIEEIAAVSGDDRTNAFNAIMLCLANLFLEGGLDFWDADDVANGVWPLMLDDAIRRDVPLPSPGFEIYEAFDAGEWDHGDPTKDPVECFTRPRLQALLDPEKSASWE